MKRLVIVAAVCAVALDMGASAYAGNNGGCFAKDKGVEQTVTHRADGVEVELSSKDPRLVADIQRRHIGVAGRGSARCPVREPGVESTVRKTATGVLVTMTAKDPGTVKKLQRDAVEAASRPGPDPAPRSCPRHPGTTTCGPGENRG
jgi:hypothetical protein